MSGTSTHPKRWSLKTTSSALLGSVFVAWPVLEALLDVEVLASLLEVLALLASLEALSLLVLGSLASLALASLALLALLASLVSLVLFEEASTLALASLALLALLVASTSLKATTSSGYLSPKNLQLCSEKCQIHMTLWKTHPDHPDGVVLLPILFRHQVSPSKQVIVGGASVLPACCSLWPQQSLFVNLAASVVAVPCFPYSQEELH